MNPTKSGSDHCCLARPLRVAIVGAGPAGIYAADALMKSDVEASIDLYERMPAPFGLIRYGVAPDHPRIKGIVTALHKVLDKPQVRLLGNIDYGSDITLEELRRFYDAVIFSTGANADRALGVPGIGLDGSYGAADFVSWYDGHPDVPRNWPLDAEKVAVLGVGNVALDVARVLAKTGDELLPTEIPPNVYEGLRNNKALEVHVFGRRGPAQAKFTPLELRELDHSPNIEVIVDPEDIDYDEGSEAARRHSKQVDMVCNTLEQWTIRDVGDRPHKLYLHFFESPSEVLGDDGKVVGLRTERTQLDGTGNVKSTGKTTDWDVQSIYRAVGYLSQNIPQLPFDEQAGTVPNEAGRVLADDSADGAGRYLPGTYVTGWIKRGPVGLVGHTKGDANETIACLLDDAACFTPAAEPDPEAVTTFLEEKGIQFTTWAGWYRLDTHERSLGEPEGRERVKVVEREDMLRASEPHKVPATPPRNELSPKSNRRRRVLLSTVSSDSHTWNLVFLQLLLEENGNEVRNLGSCVPDALIMEEIHRWRPDVLVISSVNGHGYVDGSRIIKMIRNDPVAYSVPAIIGGKLGIRGDRNSAHSEELLRAGYNAVFTDDVPPEALIVWLDELHRAKEALPS